MQAATGAVTLSNPLPTAVEFTVRAASPERWSVSPTSIRLEPGADVQLTLTLLLRRATPATLRGEVKVRRTAQRASHTQLASARPLALPAARHTRNAQTQP